MKIDKIELRKVQIPLKHFFETSFGRYYAEDHVIVKIESEGLISYGESAVLPDPSYNYETVNTVWEIQKNFIAPSVLGIDFHSIDQFEKCVSHVRGHNFAKCGFESALWNLLALKEKKPLYKMFGGKNNKIHTGVSVGIQDSVEQLVERIESFLNEGYKRIKIKIKPGWDVKVVEVLRSRFEDLPLMVDANSAYTLKDTALFKELDQYNLMMIEQPLHYEDLVDHAQLQSQINTPICLDESIESLSDAESAVQLESCRIINIKPGRVGGFNKAIQIHDFCKSKSIPVWCGGMLEFGVGRALNLALCSLDNFVIPGDVSSSSRYYAQDILTQPIEYTNGEFILSEEPGYGFDVDEESLEKFTLEKYITN